MVAPAEEEPTIEQIMERLREVKDLLAKVPGLRGLHLEMAELYEKLRRAHASHHKTDCEDR